MGDKLGLLYVVCTIYRDSVDLSNFLYTLSNLSQRLMLNVHFATPYNICHSSFLCNVGHDLTITNIEPKTQANALTENSSREIKVSFLLRTVFLLFPFSLSLMRIWTGRLTV